MKKTLTLAAMISAAALTACTKAEESGGSANGNTVLHLSIGVQASKSTASSAEKDRIIENLQLLVFNADGNCEAYTSESRYSGTIDIVVEEGPKTIWAVAGGSSKLSSVSNLEDLRAATFDLAGTDIGALLMAGSKSHDAGKDGSNVNIQLSHLSSKITVDKITRDFSSASQAAKEMVIRGIYIINAVGSVDIYGKQAGDSWYNKLEHNSPAVDALLYDNVGKALANKGEYRTQHCFYPFPNADLSESKSDEWCARKSMLVIDTTIGGEPYYYPVFIPKNGGLEAGKHYEITNITLTKTGSEDPWEPATGQDLSVSISVTDFVTGASYTETI